MAERSDDALAPLAPDIVPGMTKWEYQVAPVLNHVAAQILNNFGQDGWELVTLVPGQGGNDIAYFKRPAEG